MCAEAFFPTVQCFGREQNYEEYRPQSGQYLHSWDGVGSVIRNVGNFQKEKRREMKIGEK